MQATSSSRLKLLFGALLLAGASVFAAQGCTVTSGDGTPDFSDGGGTDSGSTTDGNVTHDAGPSDPCNECLFSKCSSLHATCMANADCSAIYFCAVKATTDAELQACLTAHPNGVNLARALSDCDTASACNLSSSCNSVCSGKRDCSDYDPSVDAGTAQTCPECSASKCATESGKVNAADSEASKLNQCYDNCASASDPAQCASDCEDVHPQGKTDLDALTTCTKTNCAAACPTQ